ncbi:MAG: hypothetical protein K2P81_16715 [Bacteriovoracaceae bacterium]|nr:hypothetical protein [Bacteriovoracaceae bacterium]
MIKYLLVLALSVPAFASELHVECKMIEQAFRNQFTIEFTSPTNAGTAESLALNFNLKKVGRDTQAEELNLVRDLSVTKFEAGEITTKPFFVITSADRNADPVYVNILVDYPQPLSSVIRFQDGMTYFSTCKSI